MAFDLSKGGSTRPQSRSGRSQGSVPTASSPRVRTQRSTRDVSGVSASERGRVAALDVITKGLAKGAATKQQVDHNNEMQQIKRDNEEYARTAKVLTQTRPDDVRQAQKTNDWSAFGDTVTQDMLGRKAFTDNARIGVGTVGGRDAASDPGSISGISGSNDPDRWRRDFLDSQLEGMNPLEAAAFADQYIKDTEGQVTTRKGEMLLGASEQAVAVAEKKFNVALSDGIVTMDEYLELEGSMARAGSLLGAKGQTAAVKRAQASLMDEAAMGKPWALKLINQSTPSKHSGLSIKQRNEDYWKEAQKGATQRQGQAESAEQKALIDSAVLALNSGEVGIAQAKANLFLAKHGAEYSGYISLVGALRKAQAGGAMKSGILAGIAADGAPQWVGDNSDHKKVDAEIGTNFEEEMLARGVNEAEIPGRFRWWVGQLVSSTDFKTQNARALLGGNPEEKQEVLKRMGWMGDQADKMFPAELGGLISRMERSDPSKYDKILEDRNNADRGDTTVDNVLAMRFGVSGQKAQREESTPSFDAAINASGVSQGADETLGGTLGFLSFGDALDIEDEGEVSLEAHEKYIQLWEEISYDNPDMTKEESLAETQKQAQKFISLDTYWSEDGTNGFKGRIVWRNNTDIMVGAEDSRENTRNPDATYHMDAIDWASDGGFARVQGHGPSAGLGGLGVVVDPAAQSNVQELRGMQSDEKTGRNMGVVPQFLLEDGSIGPETYEIGRTIWVPTAERGSPKWAMMPEATEARQLADAPEDSAGMTPIVFLPAHGAPVGDRLIWENEGGQRMGTLRYIGEDKIGKTRADLDSDRAVSGEAGTTVPNQSYNEALKEADEARKLLLDPPDNVDEQSAVQLSASHPASVDEAFGLISQAQAATRVNGDFLLDPKSPMGVKFFQGYQDFMGDLEGLSLHVYDDDNGNELSAGKGVKGARTIARGFNMDARDWPKVAKQIGLEERRVVSVKAGSSGLTNAEAQALDTLVAQETARDIYAKYEDVAWKFEQHTWIGLMSLWHHGVGDQKGETPKMDAALRAEPTDWYGVAKEVFLHSKKNFVGGHMEDAIDARRRKETMKILGAAVWQDPRIVKMLGFDAAPPPAGPKPLVF